MDGTPKTLRFMQGSQPDHPMNTRELLTWSHLTGFCSKKTVNKGPTLRESNSASSQTSLNTTGTSTNITQHNTTQHNQRENTQHKNYQKRNSKIKKKYIDIYSHLFLHCLSINLRKRLLLLPQRSKQNKERKKD